MRASVGLKWSRDCVNHCSFGSSYSCDKIGDPRFPSLLLPLKKLRQAEIWLTSATKITREIECFIFQSPFFSVRKQSQFFTILETNVFFSVILVSHTGVSGTCLSVMITVMVRSNNKSIFNVMLTVFKFNSNLRKYN